MLLHGLLAMVIPNLKFDEAETPEILKVELVKKPEPPPPIVQPEPVQPQPKIEKPEPKPLPKPMVRPQPTPVIEKDEPAPTPPAQIAPTPEVIAVAPKADIAPPAHTVPTPVPVKQEAPPAPSQTDIDDALGKYGNALWNAISKHKKYPKIAQMRGWEGEAIIELLLDSSGRIKSKKIAQSSGFEALDKQALDMVEKAAPFPTPPEALRSSNFTITVPVPFKLENG